MDHGQAPSINRTAFDATVHCLTGWAIGEVLGLVIAIVVGLPANRWLIARGLVMPW